jgi:LCP family protein required for cell wall assembly
MDQNRKRVRRSIDGFFQPNNLRRINESKPRTKERSVNDFKYLNSTNRLSPTTNISPQSTLLNRTMTNQKYSLSNNLPNTNKQKPKKKKSLKRKVVTSFAIILIMIIGVGVWLGSSVIGNIDKIFHGNIFSDFNAVFSNTKLKGESTGRINILLAGDSVGQQNHGGAPLADTIIVLSINTKDHKIFMLSIPRDLWVKIPGFPYNNGWEKINAGNDGMGTNFPGYPTGGMGQLEHLVVTDLGIPIDYYSVSNYGAFKDVVNAVGGITVDIQSPDPRGLYDPNTHLNLPNGIVHLNGQEALNLARARGDGPGAYGFPNSDFNRTAHQRQILSAIASKAKSLGFLSNPIKISDLFNALGNNVQTNLSLPDILELVNISRNYNLNNIKSYAYCSTLTQTSCGTPIITTYTNSSTGEEALIPVAGKGNYQALRSYYQQLVKQN